MKRFVLGVDRGAVELPECLDDYIDESNPVRVIEAFVDALDLGELGLELGPDRALSARLPHAPSPEEVHVWHNYKPARVHHTRRGDSGLAAGRACPAACGSGDRSP
jgi:hypothetical protein